MTWVADPLFNLLLRLDRFGKYALSPLQIWAANCTGSVLLIVIALGAMAWHYHSVSLLIAALGRKLLFMIPVSAIFKAPEGWPRWALIAYAAVLGGMGAAALSGILPAAMKDVDPPAWTASIGQAYLWESAAALNFFRQTALFAVRVRK